MNIPRPVVRVLAALGVSVACTGASRPEPPPRARTALGVVLDSIRRAHDLPALAGAIVTSDAITADAVGARRAGGPSTVTADDRFHWGSNTKAMTAALVGQLVDAGRVSWDAPLPALFPELAAAMHPAWRTVTMRDLLTHTSGLPDNPDRADVRATERADARAWRRALVARVLARPPAGARGAYRYSNIGYTVAGAAAEALAGRAYEPLLVERVLAPLGVTTAGFGPMGTPGRDDQPLQHRIGLLGRSAVEPDPGADNPPPFAPAGRAHLSVGDYARFVQAVLRGARGLPTPLGSPAVVRVLVTPLVPAGGGARAALGWFVVDRPWAGGAALTHAGSNTMNFAVAWIAPARDVAVVVATNQAGGGAERAADEAVGRLLAFHRDGR